MFLLMFARNADIFYLLELRNQKNLSERILMKVKNNFVLKENEVPSNWIAPYLFYSIKLFFLYQGINLDLHKEQIYDIAFLRFYILE